MSTKKGLMLLKDLQRCSFSLLSPIYQFLNSNSKLYIYILESDIAKDDKSVESILHLQNIVSNSSSVTCKESSQQLNSPTDPTHLFYFKS